MRRKIVVGYSGGVTSAWCAAWALMSYAKEDVVFLFHDTKEEDEDTYRFLREFAGRLNHPITERSDGRSVEELEDAESMLANDRSAFCSRVLKMEQREKYFEELRSQFIWDITLILGFTGDEWMRIQNATMRAETKDYSVRFPLAETKTSKQTAADFIQCSMGIALPRMYEWSGHANCVGCRRGSGGYWWAVKQNRPEVFARRAEREREFGHSYLNGKFLDELKKPRDYKDRESIEIGTCECGS
jgi:hypothetical protein